MESTSITAPVAGAEPGEKGLERGRKPPFAARGAGDSYCGVELFGRGLADRRDLLLGERVLDRERRSVARDLLAANQEAGLHGS